MGILFAVGKIASIATGIRRRLSHQSIEFHATMAAIIPFIARLAEQGPRLVSSPHIPSTAALELFRSCTRRHVMAARKEIRNHRIVLEQESSARSYLDTWKRIQNDGQAIFLTEMLGRLWCGILEARSQREPENTLPKMIARYVLLQHLELRRDILNLMHSWCEEAYPQVAELDFHCRRMERWTDILLGPLVKPYQLQDYTFDASRAMDYTQTQGIPGRNSSGVVESLPRAMAIDGFLESYRVPLNQHSLLREYQSGMIRSILGSLPDDSFFTEQRYLLGRIWAENELTRSGRWGSQRMLGA